jgi:hypothetical protein
VPQQSVLPDEEAFQRQVRALNEGLEQRPEELPIASLLPVLVPASFFEKGNWIGPHEAVGIDGVGLTWAFEQPEQTMLYLSHSAASHWESRGVDWREEAFENLSERSSRFSTGEFQREDGSEKTFALVFMHEDGFGPSRLLFDETLQELFPNGYRIAMPEMSCGIALSVEATDIEIAKIEAVIAHCYEHGTRPLISGLHSPISLP